jgi:hypothetical protein
VGQDRSIAQRTAQMTVMHAFGALVVGRLQRGTVPQARPRTANPQRIGNVQGNLLLQSSKDHKCTRAARVCQTEPESSQKFSNAKTAVFRERCGE